MDKRYSPLAGRAALIIDELMSAPAMPADETLRFQLREFSQRQNDSVSTIIQEIIFFNGTVTAGFHGQMTRLTGFI